MIRISLFSFPILFFQQPIRCSIHASRFHILRKLHMNTKYMPQSSSNAQNVTLTLTSRLSQVFFAFFK